MASNVTTTPRELASDAVTSMAAIASARGPAKSYGTGDITVRAPEGIKRGLRARRRPGRTVARLPCCPPARARRCRVRLMRAWVALELTAGVTAVVGGALLVAAPDGSLLQLDAAMLGSGPFSDWRLPGILLADLVGGGLLAAGMWDRTGTRRASSLGVPR